MKLSRGQFGWAAHLLAASFGAAADQIPLDIRQAAEDSDHQSPGAGGGVCPRLGQRSELAAGVHNALDERKQIKRRARQTVDDPLWWMGIAYNNFVASLACCFCLALPSHLAGSK